MIPEQVSRDFGHTKLQVAKTRLLVSKTRLLVSNSDSFESLQATTLRNLLSGELEDPQKKQYLNYP